MLTGAAGARALQTSIRIYIQPAGGGQYVVGGRLAVKRPCRLNRTVSLHVVHADGTNTVADTQKLTRSGVGVFNMQATLGTNEGLFVTAARLNVTLKSGARFHCAAASTPPIYPHLRFPTA
jgi:hypothetical protein